MTAWQHLYEETESNVNRPRPPFPPAEWQAEPKFGTTCGVHIYFLSSAFERRPSGRRGSLPRYQITEIIVEPFDGQNWEASIGGTLFEIGKMSMSITQTNKIYIIFRFFYSRFKPSIGATFPIWIRWKFARWSSWSWQSGTRSGL